MIDVLYMRIFLRRTCGWTQNKAPKQTNVCLVILVKKSGVLNILCVKDYFVAVIFSSSSWLV